MSPGLHSRTLLSSCIELFLFFWGALIAGVLGEAKWGCLNAKSV